MEFNTTLLREKFVIRDDTGKSPSLPTTALSNRMVIPLVSRNGELIETFIVRAQNMHLCIRLAAKIVMSFQRSGPIMARDEAFDFAEAWESILDEHDHKYNPHKWACVYNEGQIIFEAGARHPFLDIIEKCDCKSPGNYDGAVRMAEAAFDKAGHSVTIIHDSNIGLVLTIKPGTGRGGLILRNPNKRTNFNFIAEDRDDRKVSVPQCMTVSAAFLEGIQLAFQVGMTNEKLRLGIIEKYSPPAKEAESARTRIARLSAEVRSFENLLVVHYRPEKPEFPQIVQEAERFMLSLYEKEHAEAGSHHGTP